MSMLPRLDCRNLLICMLLLVVSSGPIARGQDVPDFANDGERARFLLDAAARLLPGAGEGENSHKESLAESYARLGAYDQAKLVLATIPQDQRAIGQCKIAIIMAKRDDIAACEAMLNEVGDRSAVWDMSFYKLDYKELAYIDLMAAKLRAGDPAGASALSDHVTSTDNRRAGQRAFLVGAAKNGQLDFAIRSVERIGHPMTEAQVRRDLMNICIDNGDFDRAVQLYEQIDHGTVQGSARRDLVRAYVKADRLDDAQQLAMALEQAWVRDGSLFYIVHALLDHDRIDDAQQTMGLMQERAGDWAGASRAIGVALAAQGRDELARQRLEAVMESTYDEKANTRFHGYLDCAIAAFDAGHTEQAAAYLDHAVELQPQVPQQSDFQYDRIAATYAHTGRIDEALAVVDAHFDTVKSKCELIAGLGFGIGVKLAQQDRLDVLLQLLRRLQDSEMAARVLIDIADKLVVDSAN